LTPATTAWTHRFNAYEKTSYLVDKVDLVRSLPAVARAKNLSLLGVLVVGPTGPLWSYHIVTFVRADTAVRVVAVVYAHARLVRKASGTISSAEYATISRTVEGVERREIRDRTAGLSAEWQTNVVFASYAPAGIRRVAFGDVELHRSGELASVVDPLLRSLRATYPPDRPPPERTSRPGRSYAAYLLTDITAEPVPELDRALAPYGFAGFDANLHAFGLGGELMVWRRVRVGYDLAVGARRAPHRVLDTDATLSVLRLNPRIGFEAFELDGLSLVYTAGLRAELRQLHVDASALPSYAGGRLLLERSTLRAELGVAAEYYAARTLFQGFFLGTRLGFARGLAETNFDEDSPVGQPETLGRGAFASLYFGLSGKAW
jgi:hypothetical protein